jgi:tryptophan synthase beta chain
VTTVPEAWLNALPDLGFDLPADLPSPHAAPGGLAVNVPPSLVRQEMSSKRLIPIPEDVLRWYRQWRPTPLRRARELERALGTRCRIYYKYEGGNLSGSHKLNTAVAQAYYYRRAGATRLTAGTGAGQWGTAVAMACALFGLDCRVYMVRASHEAKPYRKVIMEMLGATVELSPSDRTEVGRRTRSSGDPDGTLAVALGEALEDTSEEGTYFCTGSGETYSILHQTVTGIEAQEQLEDADDPPDVVVGSLGGGSNFGGLVLPFLTDENGSGASRRYVAVESSACPKLTRGRYAFDFTDATGVAPLQKMYTLGHGFAPPGIHAGGLRYHGAAKLVSALYDRDLIEAAHYPQRTVFRSATAFARAEGLVPAPESAHAIHGAVVEARRADEAGASIAILVGVSGHGMFDMTAYAAFQDGTMVDAVASDEEVADGLATIPAQPAEPVAV